MPSDLHIALATALVGILATAATDAWSIVRARAFAVPAPDYGRVGRWIAHMPGGTFRHAAIANAPAMPGERAIGWTAHYLIGIAFAALLVAVAGPAWLAAPRPGPALLVGVATVAAPFLILQPGMGAGIAASRTPRPWAARFHSLVMHVVFGAGLYVGGLAVRALGIAP